MATSKDPAQSGSLTPGGNAHMRWDTSGAQSHRCTLATASTTAAEILLNFGAKRGRDLPGSEIGIELVQRIALSPLTARHLMATLERVIADHDRSSRGSR